MWSNIILHFKGIFTLVTQPGLIQLKRETEYRKAMLAAN